MQTSVHGKGRETTLYYFAASSRSSVGFPIVRGLTISLLIFGGISDPLVETVLRWFFQSG